MLFVKIVGDKLEFAPYEIYTEDGRVIELDTREKCLENGYMEAFPFNKPPHDKRKYDLVYAGYVIDPKTQVVFIEYELREKEEEIDADVILDELTEIYNEEINK